MKRSQLEDKNYMLLGADILLLSQLLSGVRALVEAMDLPTSGEQEGKQSTPGCIWLHRAEWTEAVMILGPVLLVQLAMQQEAFPLARSNSSLRLRQEILAWFLRVSPLYQQCSDILLLIGKGEAREIPLPKLSTTQHSRGWSRLSFHYHKGKVNISRVVSQRS